MPQVTMSMGSLVGVLFAGGSFFSIVVVVCIRIGSYDSKFVSSKVYAHDHEEITKNFVLEKTCVKNFDTLVKTIIKLTISVETIKECVNDLRVQVAKIETVQIGESFKKAVQ